jgi:hypothetical protein
VVKNVRGINCFKIIAVYTISSREMLDTVRFRLATILRVVFVVVKLGLSGTQC